MIEIVSVLWSDDCDDHISSQLERQLENVESEKAGLSTSVREVQDHLDLSRKELATQRVIIDECLKLVIVIIAVIRRRGFPLCWLS